MKRHLIACACILLAMIVLALVGGNDYEDALRDQQTYCTNVASGAWPDYQGNAKEICHGHD